VLRLLAWGGASLAGILTVALCGASPSTISSPAAVTLDSFLNKVDAALAVRNARQMLALSDVDAWQKAFHAEPDPAAMTLPAAPLRRVRALSGSEFLYTDSAGRSWRLVLRESPASSWRIVLHDRPCPRGGVRRAPEFERAPPADSPATWTPLECWPLPL
jgi:hypothetical protein